MEYWHCREALYYNNVDPDDGVKVWSYNTEKRAREQFEKRVKFYIDSKTNYSLIINNNYTAIFENNAAGGFIILTWYCVGRHVANRNGGTPDES